VTLQASIATANQSTFSIPITVQAGTPLQFDNLTPLLVPDLTTVTSALPVSGLSGPITKVQVLMNLNHSYDNDLVVDLIAPDGTTVNLLSHNGQNGQNFGTICGSEATETVFDDYSLVSVNDGAAPFLGNFRPISPLSVLNGKSGTNVNNAKWHLRVSDTDFGGSGILQCWSLRIWTGTCPDGGGICELCPNTTIYGMLGYGSSLNRLSRNGIPTTCANPTSCPGSFGTFEAYDAYTFHNGPSSACITVTLNAPNTDVFSAAYLSSFDPVNTCNNYLADSGDSTMGLTPPYGSRTYSFNVAANATFIVVANGIGGSTGAYSLSVTGGSCQPNLQINPAGGNNVALKWTTSAGGYVLESTNKFGGTNKWQPVSTPPQVIGGKFVVTNSISGPNQYYRLHKP
jgi:subtilisin-like proprotein convertase family protein